jgi:hypothetical protein
MKRRQPWWVTLDRAVTKNPRQPWWVPVLIALTTACVVLFRDELGAWTVWIYATLGLIYLAVRAVRPRAVEAVAGPYPLFDAAAAAFVVLLFLVTGTYYPAGVTIVLGATVLAVFLTLGEVCRRREQETVGS